MEYYKISEVFQKMNLIVHELKTIRNESEIGKVITSQKLNLNPGGRVLEKIYKVLAKDSLLIAYCSDKNNSIDIYDSKTGKTLSISGPQIRNENYPHNILQSIQHSNLLITATCSLPKNMAAFEVFDVSIHSKVERVFSLPLTNGQIFDIACNTNSKRTALLSDAGKVLYHLYDTCNWRLLAKRKPPSGFSKSNVTSLDFSPDGNLIAIASRECDFAIGNVDSGEILFQKQLGEVQSGIKSNHCRWNSVEPIIATAMHGEYSQRGIRLIDAVTLKLTKFVLANIPILSHITWMDWHKDGNLLALCVCDTSPILGVTHHRGFVLIYDKRVGIVQKLFSDYLNGGKTYAQLHDIVRCVRWTPEGDALTVACNANVLNPLKIFDPNSDSICCEVKKSQKFHKSGNTICFLNS